MKKNCMLLVSILLIILCTLCVCASEPFEVHILDVGQGQSVLIKDNDHYMVIDGGGRSTSSFVVSYLQKMGVEHIDFAAVSHYEEDHMSGIIGILAVFPCNMLLIPSYAGTGVLYQSLATAAFSNGCDIIHPELGKEFFVGNAVIEIIGPQKKDYVEENDLSLCFRITYGDTSFMVCADAQQKSEADLVDSKIDLSADVYVVNHHGSSTSSTDAFLESMCAKYAVISCGQENSYGHPTMETLKRLQNHGMAIYRTDLQGSIIVYSDGSDVWFNVAPCTEFIEGDNMVFLESVVTAGENEHTDRSRIIDNDSYNEQLSEEKKSEPKYNYVCNTNTNKFHFPYCGSVDQMKEENRLFTNLSREELIADGYQPCGSCNP